MKKYAFNLGTPRLWLPSKLLLIMKLVTLILITSLIQVSAATLAQHVTLKESNASLESVISKIRSQTGYDFVFDYRLLQHAKKVTVNLNNEALESALQAVFEDQNMDFTIKDKIIVINEKEVSLFDRLKEGVKATLFNENISGTVIDTLGRGLIGASVSLKGKNSYHTNTDNTGRFDFQSVAEGAYKITITYIGLQKIEETLEIKKGQGMNALSPYVMKQATSNMDEVQVIAYGTTTKRFNIGSVATVSSVEIEKHPVTNVLLALQGQVPGMLVSTTSGAPGAQVKVQVRGQNTIRNGQTGTYISNYDQPLFIVDGVPMAAQNNNINLLNAFQNGGSNYATGLSPFGTLNPSDIESVTVLKDAGATSIYGSQGANGVVLITTKKGKPGKPQLSISARTGADFATKSVKMLNTQQYLAMRQEAFANDGITGLQGTDPGPTTYAPDLTVFDQNKYRDYSKYYLGNSTSNTNVHSSFSGGTNTTNFIISGGFNRQGSNFPGDLSNSVYTFHSGFNYNSADGRLHVGIITDYAYQNNNASVVASLVRNLLTPPNYPDLLDASGNPIWVYKGVTLNDYQTFGALNKVGRTQSHNLNNSMAISYEVIPGLKAKINLGYNRNTTNEIEQNPLSSMAPGATESFSTFGSNNAQTINIEPQLDYVKNIGKGELSVLIGGTYKKLLRDNSIITGYNYPNDALLGSISSAEPGRTTIVDGADIYKYIGAFGRIGYVYDQKYIVSFTGRRDGSSNFGPNRNFGNFGSAGIGWIFSEEKPVKSFLPFLSFGKLSGSYGTTGTDAVSAYRYQTFWQALVQPNSYQGTVGFEPANIYNPNYSWDVKKTLNASIDLGFLKDRILLNATYYRSRTGNQLIDSRLPMQTGYGSVIENTVANVQNSGFEFTLSTVNVKNDDFKWTTNFNISKNSNKLLAFPDLKDSPYSGDYEIGQPVTTLLAYKYKGVNPETGIFEFYTKSGEVTSNPAQTDKQRLVDLTPEFYGGLNNVITYKSFSLSFLFQFSKGMSMNWLGALYNQQNVPGQLMNLPVAALDHWKKPGDISQLQKLTTNAYAAFDPSVRNFVNSTGAYSESTYARLKNVNFSYSIPERFLKKLSLKSLQVYVNAENLFVISGFKVGDPESVGSLFTMPLQRTIVAGLSLNL